MKDLNGTLCRPARVTDAIWLRIPDPRPIPGGCDCSYCKKHPDLVPAWDTLSIPNNYEARTEANAHTIHAPEFWDRENANT